MVDGYDSDKYLIEMLLALLVALVWFLFSPVLWKGMKKLSTLKKLEANPASLWLKNTTSRERSLI